MTDMVLVLSAKDLRGVARHAYGRIQTAAGDRDQVGFDPIIAVVFSAMATEGFINEVGACAAFSISDSEPATIVALSTVLAETEASRGSTEAKYMLARIALTGRAYDRGSNPYQDFAVLMDARNALVHHKPERWVVQEAEPDILSLQDAAVRRKLAERNLLWEPPRSYPFVSLIERMGTRAVARWACEVADAMIRSLLSVLPDSECRWRLEQSGYLAPLVWGASGTTEEQP